MPVILCLHNIPLYEQAIIYLITHLLRGAEVLSSLCCYIIYNEILACMKFLKVEGQSRLHFYFDRCC